MANDTGMSNDRSIKLSDPIQYAPHAGPRRAKLFERLGIRTVADLVRHLPFRYEHESGCIPIGELPLDTIATAVGEVANCLYVPGRGRKPGRFTATLEDAAHRLDLVWFHGKYLCDRIVPGMLMSVTGKVVRYDDHRQMVNPKWQIIDDETVVDAGERYRPIYAATEELSSAHIERVVEAVLGDALEQIDDHFGADYRSQRQLPALAEAYGMIHRPADADEAAAARRRLAYDELFMLQLGMAIKRHHTQTDFTAPALRWSNAVDRHIRQRFPFELTESQSAAAGEIAQDLQRPRPMNRLLQGDVGSGKTVVALYAMLMAAASNRQAALMAPTELLAEQHFLSIGDMLRDSTVRLALLTGSQSTEQRAAVLRRIDRGEIDLVVGTQALLTETVQFADLGVVVVDEQHRFGVVQRAAIRSKAADRQTVPHCLVMTATPIPRTLSLTVFGDLDVSTIRGLPPGRQPIVTRVVHPDREAAVYDYIAGRLDDGEQAYIVLPAIEQGEANLKAVRTEARRLEQTHFAGRRIATIHGRLQRHRREKIMHQFRAGRIDVLVATTVIEVGVDVPNASIMVVEHAERFGLAQLHQLRGRVGRGSRKSLCVFISDPTTEDAAERLSAIARTTDGFDIAEADLVIRGMGELIGTRQSGLPPLRVARIPADMDLLRLARRDAAELVAADPRLAHPSHDLLGKRLVKQYGEVLDLGDVG